MREEMPSGLGEAIIHRFLVDTSRPSRAKSCINDVNKIGEPPEVESRAALIGWKNDAAKRDGLAAHNNLPKSVSKSDARQSAPEQGRAACSSIIREGSGLMFR